MLSLQEGQESSQAGPSAMSQDAVITPLPMSPSLGFAVPSHSHDPLSCPLSSLPHSIISAKRLAHARRHGLFSASQLMLLTTAQLRDMLKLSEDELIADGGWREKLIAHCWAKASKGGFSVGERMSKRRRLHGHYIDRNRTEAGIKARSTLEYEGKGKRKASEIEIAAPSFNSVTMGDARLDAVLQGAVRRGAITEISGESATGKSQLAIQMAVYAALGWQPGFEIAQASRAYSADPDTRKPRTVALLVSEGDAQATLFVRRMLQMAEDIVRERWHEWHRLHSTTSPHSSSSRLDHSIHETERLGIPLPVLMQSVSSRLLENVHISPIRDLEALEHALTYTLPGLARRLLETDSAPPLGLVLLDSLAPLFYADQPGSSFGALMLRTRWSNLLADEFKKLSSIGMDLRPPKSPGLQPDPGEEDLRGSPLEGSGAAIVILNHVSDVFERDLIPVQRILQQQQRRSQLHSKIGQERQQFTCSVSTKFHIPAQAIAKEPPLTFAAQSPFFSGLLASLGIPPNAQSAQSTREADHGKDEETDEDDGDDDDNLPIVASHLAKQAALGHVWNNCINARIFLTRKRRAGSETLDDGEHSTQGLSASQRMPPTRRLHLVFAPRAAPRSTLFEITKAGVRWRNHAPGPAVDQSLKRHADGPYADDEEEDPDFEQALQNLPEVELTIP